MIEVFSNSGPISVTLHPLLLLQCRRVGDKLLFEVINYITNEIKASIPRPTPTSYILIDE